MKCSLGYPSRDSASTGSAIALLTTLVLAASICPARATDAAVLVSAAEQPQATAAARVEQRRKQTEQITPDFYDLSRYPIDAAHEEHWRNLLWTTAVVEPQEPFVAEALSQILALLGRSGLSESQERTIDAATKVGTQLYLGNPTLYRSVGQRFREAIAQSPDPEWVAVSLAAVRSGLSEPDVRSQMEIIKQRFPKWQQNVYLRTTLQETTESLNVRPVPPLGDLLNWTIAPQQLQLYVLCQRDRQVLCEAVLKDRQGQFVRQNGELWSMPLLLRSLHRLNWNFVRGNTPQGIFRIEGVVPQPDDEFFRAFGQFSLVNLYVPFEPGAKAFLPGKPGAFKGSLSSYQSLLPPTWRDYFPIQQSFWAGRAGRSEFRIHGTGESPDFFSGNKQRSETYNWNPTIGCLSAVELYDGQGQLAQADMPKLLQALEAVGGPKFTGYLVVAEVGNGQQPIARSEIEAAIASPASPPTQLKSSLSDETKTGEPLPAPDPARLTDSPAAKRLTPASEMPVPPLAY